MNLILTDIPETIETSRLKLQMPRSGYGAGLHEAMMDGYEDCVEWLGWPPSRPDIKSIEAEVRKHHADFILRSCIRYIITDKTNNMILGRCSFPLHQFGWRVMQYGIDYFIRKSQRSKGYATEAARAMTELAFKTLNAKKVYINFDVNNIASKSVPIKLGFKFEYKQRGGWIRTDGELAEIDTYSIFSDKELLD